MDLRLDLLPVLLLSSCDLYNHSAESGSLKNKLFNLIVFSDATPEFQFTFMNIWAVEKFISKQSIFISLCRSKLIMDNVERGSPSQKLKSWEVMIPKFYSQIKFCPK